VLSVEHHRTPREGSSMERMVSMESRVPQLWLGAMDTGAVDTLMPVCACGVDEKNGWTEAFGQCLEALWLGAIDIGAVDTLMPVCGRRTHQVISRLEVEPLCRSTVQPGVHQALTHSPPHPSVAGPSSWQHGVQAPSDEAADTIRPVTPAWPGQQRPPQQHTQHASRPHQAELGSAL